MSKVAVVYWSATGNTKEMAENIATGVVEAGGEADIFEAKDFNADKASEYSTFAFGCPAMGAEQLEDSEFEPMFNAVKPNLVGKKVALFGSYGWGSGEWMHLWEEDCKSSGFPPITESVIVSGTPVEETIEKCKAVGALLNKIN